MNHQVENTKYYQDMSLKKLVYTDSGGSHRCPATYSKDKCSNRHLSFAFRILAHSFCRLYMDDWEKLEKGILKLDSSIQSNGRSIFLIYLHPIHQKNNQIKY